MARNKRGGASIADERVILNLRRLRFHLLSEGINVKTRRTYGALPLGFRANGIPLVALPVVKPLVIK